MSARCKESSHSLVNKTLTDGDRNDPSIRLRRAIHSADLVLVKRLIISHDGVLRNPDFGDQSNTSLHLAASLGHVAIAEFLIDSGHDDEYISRNTARQTPLMLATQGFHEELAQVLAARFPRCIGWKDSSGMDALMMAARAGMPGLITAFLALVGTDEQNPQLGVVDNHAELLNAIDNDGNGALHYASAWGHLKCVMLLLQAGAQPERPNAQNWLPVHYSSTVSAEVFFKNAVQELEKQRRGDKGPERRREGGVRVVSADDLDPDVARQALAAAEGGRSTPTSVRAPSRGLASRMRAGSLE